MRMNVYSLAHGDIVVIGDTQYRVLKVTRASKRRDSDTELTLVPISTTEITMNFSYTEHIELIAGKQR